MKKVLVAFLLSFLAIWSGNSMESNKGSVKGSEPMTFVLGTDKNYIVPTLVTIHSLLKNGIKDEVINIVILSEDLDKNSEQVFVNVFKEIVKKLKKSISISKVKLYRLSIPMSNTPNPWNAITGKDVDDIFIFTGLNVKGKRMPKYKAMLPFYINEYRNAKIPHYMWLDSDILINGDISDLYRKCLQSKAAIGSANYWFVSEDIPHSNKLDKSIVIRKIGILPLKKNPNAPFLLSQYHAEITGWRCSGGVMFFNTFSFSSTELTNFLNSNKISQLQDEEMFFDWYVLNDPHKSIYAFSPAYNCRPSMPAAAQETLKKLTEQKEEGAEELKKITDPKKISIWHWDGMTKPWHVLSDGLFIKNEKYKSNVDAIRIANQQWREEYEEVYKIVKELGYNINAYLMVSK